MSRFNKIDDFCFIMTFLNETGFFFFPYWVVVRNTITTAKV